MERWIVVAVLVVLVTVAVAAPPSSLPIVPGDDSGGGTGGTAAPPGGASSATTNSSSNSTSSEEEGTVPSLPVEWQAMSCELHLSGITLGGLKQACKKNHHHHHHHHHQDLHSRCCPVLAAWLYAAEAETIMEAIAATSAPSSSSSSSSSSPQVEMPVPPDDSAVCAAGLQQGLHSRGIDLPLLNASCDMSLCYCGIRLRQMAALSCPLGYFHRNKSAALPSSAPFLRALQRNCSDSSYAGCTSCISALDNSMVWIQQKTKKPQAAPITPRSPTTDCRLMGLMWLLSNNRTRFIPTVSAVLRALHYTDQSEQRDPAALCSPDGAGMPLAIDSDDGDTSSAPILNVSAKIFVLLWLLLLQQHVNF